MDLNKLSAVLGRVHPKLLTWAFEAGQRFGPVRRRLEVEYDKLLGSADASAKLHADLPRFSTLPTSARSREEVLEMLRTMLARESSRWQEGQVSGTVYHGGAEHIDFLNRVYAVTSQVNPLHSDVWPSSRKIEAELVSMVAHLVGGAQADAADKDERICGTVTSGGTESILLAVKVYRDRAAVERGVTEPGMVLPRTAHVAFDKAAAYFGVRAVHVDVDGDFRARIDAMASAINKNTVLLVGSAPSFAHGVIDPIEQLSELSLRRDIGLHVDACLGGFVLPFARKLGYPVPNFDFRLPGVTSMSIDTHKYGYAAKGTSVVLYRGYPLRRYQYSIATEWPGGLYFSPTIAGSRPGALSAAAWAAMLSLGEEGYLESTRRILETAEKIREGIEAIPELEVLGDPLWVIAFASKELDIYRVLDVMNERGWSLNGLHRPASVHLAVTLRHTEPGVVDKFLEDLRAAVARVRSAPKSASGMAPIYGLAGTLPLRGAVAELMRRYVDRLYEPDP